MNISPVINSTGNSGVSEAAPVVRGLLFANFWHYSSSNREYRPHAGAVKYNTQDLFQTRHGLPTSDRNDQELLAAAEGTAYCYPPPLSLPVLFHPVSLGSISPSVPSFLWILLFRSLSLTHTIHVFMPEQVFTSNFFNSSKLPVMFLRYIFLYCLWSHLIVVLYISVRFVPFRFVFLFRAQQCYGTEIAFGFSAAFLCECRFVKECKRY